MAAALPDVRRLDGLRLDRHVGLSGRTRSSCSGASSRARSSR